MGPLVAVAKTNCADVGVTKTGLTNLADTVPQGTGKLGPLNAGAARQRSLTENRRKTLKFARLVVILCLGLYRVGWDETMLKPDRLPYGLRITDMRSTHVFEYVVDLD